MLYYTPELNKGKSLTAKNFSLQLEVKLTYAKFPSKFWHYRSRDHLIRHSNNWQESYSTDDTDNCLNVVPCNILAAVSVETRLPCAELSL